MAEIKTQQSVFVAKAIPSLFHQTPEQFIQLLSRDGNQFLRFYWDQAGADPQVTEKTAPFGLNYDVRQPAPHTQIILIRLPSPKVASDAYFLGLAYRPLRRTPFLGVSDTTKVVALEPKEITEGEPGTQLVEWTKKLVREPLGVGPEPRLEAFYEAVLKLMEE